MSLSQAFLDELRARTSLSSLIGGSVKLAKAGREHKGCCPFHDERTPSFTVNDEKGFYHCFGCSAHGDAIRWLVDRQGLPFIDAVKELAAAAGMEVPAPSREAQDREAKRDGLRPPLEAAQALYVAQLGSATAVGAYLAERGVSEALARDFGLGFAPPGRGHLARAGIDPAAAVEAGLMWELDGHESRSGNVERGERFLSRIMVPVHDRRGRIVGFSGRAWAAEGSGTPHQVRGDGKVAKYVNSPDSPIFDKGRLLFNLHRAAEAARKGFGGGNSVNRTPRRLIIVEGQFDCIGLTAVGVAEVVAPMGTALTAAQLALAWALVPDPVVMFDGDGAGLKAARRAAETALPFVGKLGQTLKFALLAQGEDPDSLARSGGRDAVEAAIAGALPCDEFLWRFEAGAL